MTLAQAEAEARALEHACVGSEHVLLALLSLRERRAAARLADAGLTHDAARARIIRIVGLGEGGTGEQLLPYTSNAVDISQSMLREAVLVGSARIGTEHLLRALLRRRDSLAAAVIAELGADPSELAERLHRPQPDEPPRGG